MVESLCDFGNVFLFVTHCHTIKWTEDLGDRIKKSRFAQGEVKCTVIAKAVKSRGGSLVMLWQRLLEYLSRFASILWVPSANKNPNFSIYIDNA